MHKFAHHAVCIVDLTIKSEAPIAGLASAEWPNQAIVESIIGVVAKPLNRPTFSFIICRLQSRSPYFEFSFALSDFHPGLPE